MKTLITFTFTLFIFCIAESQTILPVSDIFINSVEMPVTAAASGNPIVYTIDQTGGAGGNGPASQQIPDFGDSRLQSADNFTIPAGPNLVIENIDMIGAYFNPNPNDGQTCGQPINIIVEVFNDAAGLPGSLVFSETVDGAIADPDRDGTFNLVSTTCPELSPGVYWLSIMLEMPFSPCGQYAWVPSSDDLTPGEFAFQDPDGLTGNPCSSWGRGITDCGIGATFGSLAWAINFSEVASNPIPTLGQWAIISLALILIIFGVISVIQRKAVLQ